MHSFKIALNRRREVKLRDRPKSVAAPHFWALLNNKK